MSLEISSSQKNSFATLSVPSSKIPTTTKHSMVMGNYSNGNHSEYISLAWQNMASIKSARKVSREANKAAKQYYTFTFIDDLESEEEEELGGRANDIGDLLEEDDSVHNSKFAFDDDEAWLGSRKKPEVDDIINSNKNFEPKGEVVQEKPNLKKAVTGKANVIGIFMSQQSSPVTRWSTLLSFYKFDQFYEYFEIY